MRAPQLLSVLLLASGCGGPDCGEGTAEVGGRCEASPIEAKCGAGTHLVGQSCVAEEQTCGPGTVLVEGLCLPVDPVDTCGQGTIVRDGECVALDVIDVALPFVAGEQVRVSQGSHGFTSHTGVDLYAVDFEVPSGTAVVASRAGRVVDVRSDSDTGCADASCRGDANYIILDHGDGTLDTYWHLEKDGVLVALGASVCAGAMIGRSGNTGFSTGPHLHFAVVDLWQQSLPLEFAELRSLSDGVAFPGATVISANAEQTGCEAVSYSTCPSDLFLPRGVLLDPGLPCVVLAPDQPTTFAGQVLAFGFVQLARYRSSTQSWAYECFPVDEGGRFAVTVSFPAAVYGSRSYMMWSAAYEDCASYEGWGSAPQVFLSTF